MDAESQSTTCSGASEKASPEPAREYVGEGAGYRLFFLSAAGPVPTFEDVAGDVTRQAEGVGEWPADCRRQGASFPDFVTEPEPACEYGPGYPYLLCQGEMDVLRRTGNWPPPEGVDPHELAMRLRDQVERPVLAILVPVESAAPPP